MKRYKFLLKPLFFVFNLFFATWLVLAIEKIEPSDFGRNSSFFDKTPVPRKVSMKDKPYLIDLFTKYKKGLIDSNTLDRHINAFLSPPEENVSVKK
jgi:hypothetical protein